MTKPAPNETQLFKEIYEQPDVIARLIQNETKVIAQLAEAIKKRNIEHVVVAARGTSDNAGRYATYVLGAQNGFLVTLATPSLYSVFEQPPKFNNSLVLGISQSGQSPDIISVLGEAKSQGALTAAITNTPDSPLAEQGDFVVNLHAAPEEALAATKSYTAQLAAIAILSSLLKDDKVMMTELERIPETVSATLSMNDEVAQIAQRYRYMQNCIVISRGYNLSTAFELSLKLKELAYINVDPYSSADFLHGPIALLEPGYPVIVLAPSGKTLPDLQSFTNELVQRQAEVIVISDDDALLSLGRIPLRLPSTAPEWLSPIAAIVPGQLFALHLTHTSGHDVDSPRGLRKVIKTL